MTYLKRSGKKRKLLYQKCLNDAIVPLWIKWKDENRTVLLTSIDVQSGLVSITLFNLSWERQIHFLCVHSGLLDVTSSLMLLCSCSHQVAALRFFSSALQPLVSCFLHFLAVIFVKFSKVLQWVKFRQRPLSTRSCWSAERRDESLLPQPHGRPSACRLCGCL